MITTEDLIVHDGVDLSDASQACAGERFAKAMAVLRGRATPAASYCAPFDGP